MRPASHVIVHAMLAGLELPLKLVQSRLGHASIQMMADRYGHLFPSDDGAELRHIEPFAREIAQLHRGDGGKIRVRDQVGNRQFRLPVAGARFFSSNE